MSKKLDILIISHYFPPSNSIASHRPYSWAKYWSKMGHDVTILTTKKKATDTDLLCDISDLKFLYYDNFNSMLASLKNNVKKVDTVKKSSRVSFKSLILNSLKQVHQFFGKIGAITWDARMPNIICTGQNKGYKLVEKKWDLVISTFAPYATHQIAYKLKKQGLAEKWIADYRDLWTETHLYSGLFPFTIYEEYLEKKFNTTADFITTVSAPLAKQIKEKYNIANVEVIENGFDLDDLGNIPQEKYWAEEKIRIIYTGSIYKGYRDPSPLFEALMNIKNRDENLLNKLEILFAGGLQADLNELINKYGVNKYVKHLGMLKREEVLHMQRDANILLFLEFESEETKGILTGKLFEYLASGTEIWVVGLDENSSVGKIIKTSDQGISFGKNVELINKQLIELLTKKKRKEKKINQDLLKYYSRENLAKKMLGIAF